jgi:general secretion pathway protein B
MSYILEALKKSDSERQASAATGVAPGAIYVVAPGRRAGSYGTLLLAGGGMLAIGLALGALRPWQAPPVPGAAASAAAFPQTVVAMPPAAVQTPVAPTPTAQTAAAQTAAAVKPGAAGPLPAPAARPAVPAPKTAGDPAAALPARPAAAPAAKVAARTPPPRPAVAEASAKPRPPTRLAAAEPAPTPVAPRPAGQVVAYRDLPAEIRESVPKVSFGGFAGGDEADGRVAFINNRLVKEGEEVSPGVRLERVGTDGVVLSYKGHRFRPGP